MGSKTINLMGASLRDLQEALTSTSLTSVDLVSLYLRRIGAYDTRGPSLNSVCLLNPNVFNEAQASDSYQASGQPPRPLEGIPFTVKDSFQVKGMSVAAGSPAFSDLVSPGDAAIAESLRAAGAIALGKANMPAMADGGIQRGLYGRAESPYDLRYSTTAYASGSSNGCGTSTAACFAAFGFAGETVSSGRSPGSNNALVGYSPSRGVIPNRGQWPLYPTCDVIVPHCRSVGDLFDVLNVIVSDDVKAAEGLDFWRNQPFVAIPRSASVRPADYRTLEQPNALQGKRIGVPRCFLGQDQRLPHVYTESVLELWNKLKPTCNALYTKKDFLGQGANVPGMKETWQAVERCDMIATAWDDFLRAMRHPKYPNLTHADPEKIHPHIAPMDDPSQHSEAQNQVRYSDMIDRVRVRTGTINDFPGCPEALQALEAMRKGFFEDWMDANAFDLVAFPTNGDVPFADADETFESMVHALQDGIKYANGGRALKHLSIPCITLPMGNMKDKGMPVGLTMCTKGWDDSHLLQCAFSYETGTRRRVSPPLTPPLASDEIFISDHGIASPEAKPILTLDSVSWITEAALEETASNVVAVGTAHSSDDSVQLVSVTAIVNGEEYPVVLDGNKWTLEGHFTRPSRNERFPSIARVPKDQIVVVVQARTSNGRSAGILFLD